MSVRYIRVNAVSDLFAPVSRATGNTAIVGDATAGPQDDPQLFTNPTDAKKTFPGALGDSIALAFQQTPGPPLVYGVRFNKDNAGAADWAGALATLETVPVQIVALANTPLESSSTAAITALFNHVDSVSKTGADGMERIGVAMLKNGSSDPALVTGTLASKRMVYIAHKSDEDAAAAVAGTIAGYAPQVSLLLKPVSIDTDLFTNAEIIKLIGGGDETDTSGPVSKGVNWFARPALIPGSGTYMGEGYTGDPTDQKFIDIVRVLDDVSFKLKAQLIRSIGNVRISRTGIRSLIAQMESVLDPLVTSAVLDSYTITAPLLALLDKDPKGLTPSEQQQITNAHANRLVQVAITVEYAAAIHRLVINLTLK